MSMATKRLNSLAPYLMLIPSLGLALLIMGYPVYDLIQTSVHQVSRFGMLQQYVGWANFSRLFHDPLFMPILVRTLGWTFWVVFGTISVSIPVALILNEDFYGRAFARTLILLPWAISLTFTAIIWKWALNGQYGLLNATLMKIGLMKQPIEWLSTGQSAFPFEIGIGILASIPFTVTVLMGGLSSIPREVYDAAKIDGSRGLHLFRYITLPLIRSFVNIAVVLNVIYVFNSFPIIWVLTEGGPANSTDVLVTYLYKLAFRFGELDKAAALSLGMVAILLIFSLVYVRLVGESDARV